MLHTLECFMIPVYYTIQTQNIFLVYADITSEWGHKISTNFKKSIRECSVNYGMFSNRHREQLYFPCEFLLLSGELLAERCRTDDLMPSIPVCCLPPSRVDTKVLGLNVLIYYSQPGGSWSNNVSANQVVVTMRRWWHGGGPPLELIAPGPLWISWFLTTLVCNDDLRNC